METTHTVDLKPARDNSGDETEEKLDVKVTPIKTEGASQSTCHNPCNAM